jgi:hypothetical protein
VFPATQCRSALIDRSIGADRFAIPEQAVRSEGNPS